MRHPVLRTPLPVIGITTALIIGGGVAAFAAWDVSATPETFTVQAAHIPRMGPPRVRSGKIPRIRWGAVELLPGVPAQRYIVTRHLGPIALVACDVPPGATLQCADEFAPAGYRATYSVAATYGASWVGTPGAPSRAVTMPGTPVPMMINGVLVVPDPVTGVVASSPPASSSSSSSSLPSSPSASPSSVSAAPVPVPSLPPIPPDPPDDPPPSDVSVVPSQVSVPAPSESAAETE
jgi:hypothetical protein